MTSLSEISKAFGIAKSQLPDGSYIPASRMTAEQRAAMRSDVKRTGYDSRHFRWRARYRTSFAGSQLLENQRTLGRWKDADVSSPEHKAYRRGWESRTKRPMPTPKEVPAREVPFSPLAAVGGGTQRKPLMVVSSRLAGENPDPDVQHAIGVHESAHYATDSDVRRGRTRNPHRLAAAGDDPLKIAREEGRADGTAALRSPKGAAKFNSGYESGRVFNAEQQAEYNRIRRNMGAPNPYAFGQRGESKKAVPSKPKPKPALPEAAKPRPPYRGARIGRFKGFAAAGAAAAVGGGGYAAYRHSRGRSQRGGRTLTKIARGQR